MNDVWNRAETLSPLKKSLLLIEQLQAKVAALQRSREEPIAVIGMACRFPGADSPAAFWQLLRQGECAIREVPADRLDLARLYQPHPAKAGKMYMRHGGFLERVDGFDALFFNISPREAVSMDPQQRLFLEVSWEALEDAGIPPDRLAGSRTGVFVGVHSKEYAHVGAQSHQRVDAYYSSGVDASYIPGRLSYALDLRGPSEALDTACSSSLTAVHAACQSLHGGESSLAIVGGVKLILAPQISLFLCQAGVMSPSGCCRAFDAAADGMVQGEGCGVVVLKRLSDAVADGDRVLALIRGTAVNHGGRSGQTSGLMAPSPLAQAELYRAALDRARIEPEQISYVEAHGTGTRLGDPIELRGLAEVFCRRDRAQPLLIGSVKTNIGHTESAAGIAGLIKTISILQHDEIPPSLNFAEPNPEFDWQTFPLQVASRATPLPRQPEPRLVAVNAFGLSGVNAHAILQEYRAPAADNAPPDDRGPHLLALSARSEAALAELTRSYIDRLTHDEQPLHDICYTAARHRQHHRLRVAAVGATGEELTAHLAAFRRGETRFGLAQGNAEDRDRQPRAVFVFTGQGSQWSPMGRELWRHEPVFKEEFDRCVALYDSLAGESLRDMMWNKEAARLNETDVAQPAIFALQMALAAWWRAHGIEPCAVIGHSVGEVAAACLAGVYSLEDAVKLIFHRSRIMQRAAGNGMMAAVALPAGAARQAVQEYADRLAVAAANGPASCVLSGEADALARVLERLHADGVVTRRLRGKYAFHSPQLRAYRTEMAAAVADLTPSAPQLPFFSTVTCGPITSADAFTAHYWADNLCQPVLFGATIESMIVSGYDTFVEVGPHPALSPNIDQWLQVHGRSGVVLSSLARGQPERATLRNALARLYCRGAPVDFRTVYPRGRLASLPAYPWQRERFWLPVDRHGRDHDPQARPFLGRCLRPARQPGTYIWEIELDADWPPYLKDHRVLGAVVLPATAYIEMALQAAAAVFSEPAAILENLVFHDLLLLHEGAARTLQLTVIREGATASFEFLCVEGERWTLQASGRMRAAAEGVQPPPTRAAAPDDCPASGEEFYRAAAQAGLQFGPAFRGIARSWRDARTTHAALHFTDEVRAEAANHQIHPAMLDAVLQAALLGALREDDVPYVPIGIERLRIWQQPDAQSEWTAVARPAAQEPVGKRDAGTRQFDLMLTDADGRPLVEITGLKLHTYGRNAGHDLARHGFEVGWQAQPAFPRASKRAGPRRWLILADDAGVAAEQARRLQARGATCVLVHAGDDFAAPAPQQQYRINAAAPEQWRRLLAELAEPCDAILHAWSLDLAEGTALERAQTLGCLSVVYLVQALTHSAWPSQPRLWLLTAGAQAIGATEAPAVLQAPLWGLARALAYEQPEMRCTRIDLGRAAKERGMLDDALSSTDDEDEIALRGGTRYVARLQRVIRAAPPHDYAFRPDATYLITGGLGGIGLELARWLATQGVRHIALASRSAATVAAQATLAEIAARGVKLATYQTDVTQRGDVARLLARIAESGPPLAGVFHAAGLLADATVLQLDGGRLGEVLAPKVAGALHLHELAHDLDLFVLFSSTASLIGSPGQGNYCAANAALDALAHRRRALGLPALSINWGAWGGAGMVADAARAESLGRRGLTAFAPQDGLAALGALLAAPRSSAQTGVMFFDAQRWCGHYQHASRFSLFKGLLPDRADTLASTRRELRGGLLRALPGLPRQQLVEDYLRHLVAQVLRLAPDQIEATRPLTSFGVDSLTATELRNRLMGELQITLPLQTFLGPDSVTQIGDLILTQLTPTSVFAPAVADEEREEVRI